MNQVELEGQITDVLEGDFFTLVLSIHCALPTVSSTRSGSLVRHAWIARFGARFLFQLHLETM